MFVPLSGEGYALTLPDGGLRLEVRYLRRDRSELLGELDVLCDWPGAKTFEGSLSMGDFNFSSVRSRSDRAKLLAERAKVAPGEIDWLGLLDELCARVIHAERLGTPAQRLKDVPSPEVSQEWAGGTVPLLQDHPVLWFGDGGSGKSFVALYCAAELATIGVPVLYCDWEFSSGDHAQRLRALCPNGEPADLWHLRCEQPITRDLPRIKKTIRDHGIRLLICDSVAFATEGDPHSAEAAQSYFRAVRALGVGSLHIAHVSKAEDGDQKPYGSVFWHNGARSTWFFKRATEDTGGDRTDLALYHRKANTGRLQRPIGLGLTFRPDSVRLEKIDVASVPELAAKLSVVQRMRSALNRGALSVDALTEAVDSDRDTVGRYIRKYRDTFTRVPSSDGSTKIGLAVRR